MTSRSKYYHVTDGEWIAVPRRGYREQCCDCGLIHRLNFKIKDRRILVQAFRDGRATSGARRTFQFTKDD